MKSFKSRIFLSTILMTGMSLLLPVDAAHAQEGIQVEMTIESTTVNSQTGKVVISGTVTCSEPAGGTVFIDINQPTGRQNSISGSGNDGVQCDRNGEPYILSVFAFDGRFKPGTAVIEAFFSACTPFFVCGSMNIPRFNVRLEPQK